jgi:mannose/cellobiose epimerase-like protein (N-acyl-D-glucosamine 2-epimerase family)
VARTRRGARDLMAEIEHSYTLDEFIDRQWNPLISALHVAAGRPAEGLDWGELVAEVKRLRERAEKAEELARLLYSFLGESANALLPGGLESSEILRQPEGR